MPKARVMRLENGLKMRYGERSTGRAEMSKLSMSQVAKELEISPAYLSYMLNGKEP